MRNYRDKNAMDATIEVNIQIRLMVKVTNLLNRGLPGQSLCGSEILI